jgi:hypothetical protein
VFRLCSYAVLLAGSAREISSYWQALPEAVLRQRRAAARDLADGVAPELSYLLRNLGSLDGTVDTDTAAQLRRAVERAQIEARLAVSRLGGSLAPVTGGDTEIVGVPMARTAADGRRRHGFRPLVLLRAGSRPRRRDECPTLKDLKDLNDLKDGLTKTVPLVGDAWRPPPSADA